MPSKGLMDPVKAVREVVAYEQQASPIFTAILDGALALAANTNRALDITSGNSGAA
jgi:hypothetical protein